MYHIRQDETLVKHNHFQLHHELRTILISLPLFYEQDNTCMFCMVLLVHIVKLSTFGAMIRQRRPSPSSGSVAPIPMHEPA